MRIEVLKGDDVLDRFADRIQSVGQGKARPAFARALNRVVDSTHGRVAKLLTREMGVKRPAVGKAMRKVRASAATLEGKVIGAGKHFSLIDSRGVKIARVKGTLGGHSVRLQRVSAGAWNVQRTYKGAFAGRGAAGAAAGAGATHIFARKGAGRFPIRKLWGPSVPREMVRDHAVAAFEKTVAEVLPTRIDHELSRLID